MNHRSMNHRDVAEQLYQHVEDVLYLEREPIQSRESPAFKQSCIEGFVKILKVNIEEPKPTPEQ